MYPPSYDRDGWPRKGPRNARLRHPWREGENNFATSWNGVGAIPAETAESKLGLADRGWDVGEWHLFQPSDGVALRVLARLALAANARDREATRLAFDRSDYGSGVGTYEQMERVRAARPASP